MIRSAVVQNDNVSSKVRNYRRCKKEGMCRCGNPVARFEENVLIMVKRGGEIMIERGRPASFCRTCLDKSNERYKVKHASR